MADARRDGDHHRLAHRRVAAAAARGRGGGAWRARRGGGAAQRAEPRRPDYPREERVRRPRPPLHRGEQPRQAGHGEVRRRPVDGGRPVPRGEEAGRRAVGRRPRAEPPPANRLGNGSLFLSMT